MSANEELLIRAVADISPLPLAQEKLKKGEKLRVYLGIDPTGTKLHLGHSVPLRKLRAFQDAGHHVIFLIGSFTAMIGDPSGRDQLRQPLTKEQVLQNFETYKEQAGLILDFDKIQVVYNHEWLEKLTMSELIKLTGHFTVQQMIERDMFEKRLSEGNPIGVHEFLYPFLVGYDSVMLDVDCELGGSDQYFNMLAGRTLQKAYGKREKFVLTTKLVEGTDGRKMSKTYENCIYLTDAPNDMYGKILSIKDDLMLTYMECCTDISLKDIQKTKGAMEGGDNPKKWKMKLAREIVTLYHGKDAAKAAEKEFEKIFRDKGLPDDIEVATVGSSSFLIDVMVRHALAPSKGEARRLIQQGGVKMNEKPVESADAKVEEGIVKVGKRKFLRLSVQ